VRPTLSYLYVGKDWPRELKWDYSLREQGYSAAMAGITALSNRESEGHANLRKILSFGSSETQTSIICG
jgi:hypothetical protein